MTKASDNAFPSILVTEGTEPAAPAAGKQRVYIDSTSHHLSRTDSAGVQVDIEAAGSGNVATDAIWDGAGDLAVGTGANTAAKLTKGSDGDVLTISPSTHLPVWAAPAASGAMTQLADTTLSGTATSIVFSTISGSYNHLRVVFQGRSDRAGQVFEGIDIQFNGDTGSNYDWFNPDWNATNGYAGADGIGQTSAQVGSLTGATAAAGRSGIMVVEIPNYAATVFDKQFTSLCCVIYGTSSGNVHTVANVGLWRSTAAITQITLKTRNGSNFIVGTRATLYGML